jgi:AraC-like DNA-binding protein
MVAFRIFRETEMDFKAFYRYLPRSERDKKWGLHVTTGGETKIPPNSVYPPPGHPKGYDFNWARGRVLQEFALIYISRGGGTFECGKNFKCQIAAGNVMVLLPDVWHRYSPDRETGWDEHWVGFDGEFARRWIRHGFLSPEHPVLKTKDEDNLLTLFTAIVSTLRGNHPAMQQVLGGVTCHIVGVLYSGQQQAFLSLDSRAQSVVEKAISRIQTGIDCTLDFRSFAQESGISYSWFRSTFAHQTGLSPHQYVLQLRLARARNLLANTDRAVKEIAAVTGFHDEFYFSRIFRRRTGFTPSQWRARSRPAERAG